MASLTRFMSMPAAAAATAVVFSVYHFNKQDFLSLWGLGFVMGVTYGRSRNLLSSMVVHGVWNVGVLAFMFTSKQAGDGVQEALEEEMYGGAAAATA